MLSANNGKRARERSHTISGLPSETLGIFLQVMLSLHAGFWYTY